VCRAERIGHGVRSVEDPELVTELSSRGIPLEVCPSSNLHLGVVESLSSHPVDDLWRRGVEITVSSDDPPFFGTSLSREYELLAQTFGYGPSELAALAMAGIRHAFVGQEERARLEAELRTQAGALGEELFGAPVSPATPEEIRSAGTLRLETTALGLREGRGGGAPCPWRGEGSGE
jgi:adenosine deaminase